MKLDRPKLLFTVDVEEDMPGWEILETVRVENVRALPELGELCGRRGVAPTYLCAYTVATCKPAAGILRDLAQQGGCEIGTHMHAWNTPPYRGVPGRTGEERRTPYYQSELGADCFRAKLANLHSAVGEISGKTPTSHRAGRFGIDAATLQVLSSFGYVVDSSVTPLEEHRADGGPDFRRAPQLPYRPSRDDVTQPGDLPILEIPVSVALSRHLPRLASRVFVHLPPFLRLRGLLSSDYLGVLDFAWLYPARFPLRIMRRSARALLSAGSPVLNVFLHSSELVPGASGRIRTEQDVARCLRRLDGLFAFCIEELGAEPATLTEAARLLCPELGTEEPVSSPAT